MDQAFFLKYLLYDPELLLKSEYDNHVTTV